MTDQEWYSFREKCPWRARNIFTEFQCISGARCIKKQDCGLVYVINFNGGEERKFIEEGLPEMRSGIRTFIRTGLQKGISFKKIKEAIYKNIVDLLED